MKQKCDYCDSKFKFLRSETALVKLHWAVEPGTEAMVTDTVTVILLRQPTETEDLLPLSKSKLNSKLS